MPRIVSLIASATEIVCALGFEDQLVGRSHECDYPPSVRLLPICTEPAFEVEGSSREIDKRVKTLLRDGLSIYRIHLEMIKSLQPDVVVTQSQCDVCAVSYRDVVRAFQTDLGCSPNIVALVPNSLSDVWTDISKVAEALNAPQRSVELVNQLRSRIEAIATQTQLLADKPTVACLEWLDPMMAAGNWMPELVELAGGVNLFGEAGKHSPWMTWEQLRARDPDVLVVLPCGFDINRTRQELPLLTNHPDWNRLRAVTDNRVFLVDGNAYFNRPGPRLVESLEILAELLHPTKFQFGHEGTGWQRP